MTNNKNQERWRQVYIGLWQFVSFTGTLALILLFLWLMILPEGAPLWK